ncbi:MAG: NAD(P)H-hydrate dehydratase [Candidatus Micrarchaeota archaeon]
MQDIIKSLYVAPANSHKGENGKLLIIGGSEDYHGAPIFSLLAARRFVDLLYFYPGESDELLVRAIKHIPEVIVVTDLEIIKKVDCTLFGIGLGKSEFDINLLKGCERLVIDGDGLKRFGSKIPKNAIITPHEAEFRNLFNVPGTQENVHAMAAKYDLTILKKDPSGDIISDGKEMGINYIHNQGMTKGGTGDVLAGFVAALACKNASFESASAGAQVVGYAGELLSKQVGFNFCASDLANKLAEAYFKLKKE